MSGSFCSSRRVILLSGLSKSRLPGAAGRRGPSSPSSPSSPSETTIKALVWKRAAWRPDSTYAATRTDATETGPVACCGAGRSRSAARDIARTGCQLRFLPECFGPWTRVWSQFCRWSRNGTWARALGHHAQQHVRRLKRDASLSHRRVSGLPRTQLRVGGALACARVAVGSRAVGGARRTEDEDAG